LRGLGVTSYLLVVFYQRNKSYNAGIITALTNRLGDVGILISIGLIFYLGDWSFLNFSESSLKISEIVILIWILSACTKRAQMPFSAWLPAAIAAPTPVSALVHSSTLVTAGVYLLIRFNNIFKSSNSIYFLFILGMITIFIAGLAAIFETDIKKIIALSTLRQLGVIIIVLGAQKSTLAYFHLLSHAYFKAILFMCAGIIIHNIKDYQDLRTISNSKVSLPLVTRLIIVSNFSLCGLPFLRGFYSKDLILELIIVDGQNIFCFFVIIFSTLLTVSYSWRLIFLVGANSLKRNVFFSMNDKDKNIFIGIFFLYPFAILGGIFLRWSLISRAPCIFIPFWLKIFILGLILIATFIIFCYFFNILQRKNTKKTSFFINIWFMPLTFRILANKVFFGQSKKTKIFSEISWIEIILYVYFKNTNLKYGNYFDNLIVNSFLNFIFITILFRLIVI